MLEVGDKMPDFTLPCDDGGEISLSDWKGQVTVLFLYPKDDTSGCTKEAIGFTEAAADFEALGVKIYGLSPDGIENHEKFKTKHDLGMPLIADEEKELIMALGSWVEKNMYGRKYMGVDRSTFIIDKDGKIAALWRKVRVTGHVKKVLTAAQELGESA